MRRTLIAVLALAAALAPAATAQSSRARGTLYTRVEGDQARAAIRVQVEDGWHLYHTELGGPKAIGTKLEIEWHGPDIDWEEPLLPEPERHVDRDEPLGWAFVHKHTIVIYARGEALEETDGSDVVVELAGQTCEDRYGGTCVPYRERLESAGRGPDAIWAGFPAEAPAEAEAEGELDPSLTGAIGAAGAASDQRAAGELFVRIAGGTAQAAVRIEVADGWHLYHGPTAEDIGPGSFGIPTTVELSGAGIEWGPVVYPEPQRFDDPFLEAGFFYGHEGTLVLRATGKLTGDGAAASSVHAKVVGQTCDEAQCLLYKEELVAKGDGPDGLFAAGASGPGTGTQAVPTGVGGAGEKQAMGLGQFLLLAVFWGIFTLLMPCTYPMIPITISFFTKQAIAREGKVLSLALAYGAGIVLIFVLIGILIGPAIIPFAQGPVFNLVIGALFLLFALVLFGVVDLQPPAFMMNVAGKASSEGGLVGVFIMGATLVVTSFTCTAPFVGSLLGVGASEGYTRIVLGMGVFGLTVATPFVFLSLVPGKLQRMPQAGEWMHVLKVFLGFVELAAALKFFSNSDLVWQWGILSREVFLVLWMGIFLAAAVFLFGWIHLKGETEREIGPVRMLGGVATLLFALYCSLGLRGYVMDDIMTAIIPPYSSERLWGTGGDEAKEHAIVEDDLEAAVASADASDKLLLVNFTGLT